MSMKANDLCVLFTDLEWKNAPITLLPSILDRINTAAAVLSFLH